MWDLGSVLPGGERSLSGAIPSRRAPTVDVRAAGIRRDRGLKRICGGTFPASTRTRAASCGGEVPAELRHQIRATKGGVGDKEGDHRSFLWR
ncbi:MAG TPA: hypothetical protein PLM24_03080 [Methanothrix sp.]|nr:hypothetical protein [Methanothrix sp.]HPJ84209.1 hypothetical protein [Methanothrix sp.]HPR66099.1 hypothetical protein [Methanothrix sp.]